MDRRARCCSVLRHIYFGARPGKACLPHHSITPTASVSPHWREEPTPRTPHVAIQHPPRVAGARTALFSFFSLLFFLIFNFFGLFTSIFFTCSQVSLDLLNSWGLCPVFFFCGWCSSSRRWRCGSRACGPATAG